MEGPLLLLVLLGCCHASMALSSLSPFRSFSRTGFEDCDSDVIFVIDESGSISRENYVIMIDFIEAVVLELDSFGLHDIIYGSVTYSTQTNVDISLSARMNEAQFIRAIRVASNPQQRGWTYTDKGIIAATNDFNTNGRQDSNRIMIVLTDGFPNDYAKAAAAATDAKDNFDIKIVGVCIGCALSQLQSMVSEPTANNILDVDFSQISAYAADLASSICPPRGRKICECDMIFVMDGSGSISNDEGDDLIDFVKDVVTKLGDLNGNDIHYGSVVFARRAAVRISLEKEMDAQMFVNAVSLDRRGLGSVTKTHLGIQEASLDFHDYGRNNTCWLMVILSDGEPCCDEGDDELAKIAATHAKLEDVELFSVCIAPDCDEFQLKDMVSEDVDDHYLQAEDTSKLDDYVRDLVALLCPDPCFETPADVIFMLDHSGSLSRAEFDQMRQFVANIASKVASSTYSVRIGVITFNYTVTQVIKLTAYEGALMDDLDDAINAIAVTGGSNTNLKAPLLKMIEMFNDPAQERHGSSRIGVMVSDFGTSYEADVRDIADNAKFYEGVEMVSVSIGSWLNPSLVQYIASEPKQDHMFQVCECGDLDAIVNMMVKIFCIPSYCIHVPVDVVFVIDRSGSVPSVFMPMVKDFLKDVYTRLDIYTKNARLGAVVYTGSAHQAITLDQQSHMLTQIDSLPNTTGGWTNTVEGLEKMMDQFTLYGNEVAQWVGVVMTDGGDWSVLSTSNAAKAMSIKMIAIAIGDRVYDYGLDVLVGPGGKVLTIKSYTALRSVMTVLVKFFCPPCEPADVVFVIDASGSISEEEMFIQTQFVLDLSFALLEYPDNRVGVVVFAMQAFDVATLAESADKDAFINTLNSYTHSTGGPTYLANGINKAIIQFQTEGRSDVEQIMVILTDGYVSGSPYWAISAADQARNLGIRIAVVAVSPNPNKSLLKEIASHPYSKYSFAGSKYVSLMKLENAVKKLLCASPCKDKLAVVFAIDKSYSIHDDLFNEAVNLVHNVADILFDNAPNVIMGATIFDGVNAGTALYNIPATFHAALNAMMWPLEDYTNMASALHSAALLADSAGINYLPVVVLLSDGSATDMPYALFVNGVNYFGARFITVGIGPDVNELMMSKLASKPVHQNSIMSKGESLWTLKRRLAKLICPVAKPKHKKMCGGQVILTEISMCCDGVPQKRPAGVPACCSQESYNMDTHTCCDDSVQERSMADRRTCPSKDCYDATQYICCEGGMTAMNGQDMGCCGPEPYNKEHYVCCNGMVTEKVMNGDDCCAGIHYSTAEFMCCWGILNARIYGSSNGYCCSTTAIFSTDYCCDYYYYPSMVYRCY